MTKLKDSYFTIHYFMVAVLGLSGNELLVYAVIYSYCVSDGNLYSSIENISKRIGCSVCSVRRALRSLVASELVFDLGTTVYKTHSYAVNLDAVKKAKRLLIEEGENAAFPHENQNAKDDQNAKSYLSKCSSHTVKMIPNNKVIKKITTTTSNRESEDDYRYNFLTYGNEGLVELTIKQHKALLDLVGRETLSLYIMRLEGFMLSNPSAVVKCAYKTIRQWIEEDTEV